MGFILMAYNDSIYVRFACTCEYGSCFKGAVSLMTVYSWENHPYQYYWQPIAPSDLFMRVTVL